jgi:hypothetical protein
MRAVLLPHRAGEASRDLGRSILGQPLVHRQLSWLRANGILRVVIARADHAALPPELRAEVLASAGVAVSYLPTSRDASPRDILRRLTPEEGPVVMIPHATFGHADIGAAIARAERERRDVVIEGGGAAVHVMVRHPIAPEPLVLEAPGSLRCVDSEALAHLLSIDILEGRQEGVVIRGSEVSPGVFVARGAVIEDGARLVAPVYLGPGSHVAAGAEVGPGAILDEGAVVERGAVVRYARVAARTIVGAGVVVERALADRDRILAHRGLSFPLGDALLVGERLVPGRDPGARVLGALALAAVTPFARLGGDRLRQCAAFLRRAATDASAPLSEAELEALVPEGTPEESREATRRLYAASRRPWVDLSIAWDAIHGRPAGVAP